MIPNLKKLNESVVYLHFKMDALWTVIMKPNRYMVSIDIKDAYYSLPAVERDQKYLKFERHDALYKFPCFPNGPALCPAESRNFCRKMNSGNRRSLLSECHSHKNTRYLATSRKG